MTRWDKRLTNPLWLRNLVSGQGLEFLQGTFRPGWDGVIAQSMMALLAFEDMTKVLEGF